jgi:hypothetical protein
VLSLYNSNNYQTKLFYTMMSEYVSALVLGGILGMIGQGLRVIVGLKKLYDALADTGDSMGGTSRFDSRRLWLSLFIGFVAGSFGMILKIDYESVSTMIMNKEFMISIVAIGYMGVDFIEGVMKSYLSKFERGLDSSPIPSPTRPAEPQFNPTPAPVNNSPQDGSMASAPTDDMPVMDAPLNSGANFNIPSNIPKAM